MRVNGIGESLFCSSAYFHAEKKICLLFISKLSFSDNFWIIKHMELNEIGTTSRNFKWIKWSKSRNLLETSFWKLPENNEDKNVFYCAFDCGKRIIRVQFLYK